MEEFISTYKSDIIFVIVLVLCVLLLRFLTNVTHRKLVKKAAISFPNEKPHSLNLLKRILKVLWLVLGSIMLINVFIGNTKYDELSGDFKLVLYLGLVAAATIVAGSSANLWFIQNIRNKIKKDEDPTRVKFLRYVVVLAIYFTGLLFFLLAFPGLKGVAQTALGGAGVIAIIAGVASQEALANLVGGLFIISFKPFQIGDIVQLSDSLIGTVKEVTLRHTVIQNFDNKMIVIPNAIINKERLINYDLGEEKCCERIHIGISYDSDIDLAKSIMREECEAHKFILDNRTEIEKVDKQPIVETAVISLDDSSVTLRAWAWARNYPEAFAMRNDVLESIKKRFDREGVEIPFPHRTVVMKEMKRMNK